MLLLDVNTVVVHFFVRFPDPHRLVPAAGSQVGARSTEGHAFDLTFVPFQSGGKLPFLSLSFPDGDGGVETGHGEHVSIVGPRAATYGPPVCVFQDRRAGPPSSFATPPQPHGAVLSTAGQGASVWGPRQAPHALFVSMKRLPFLHGARQASRSCAEANADADGTTGHRFPMNGMGSMADRSRIKRGNNRDVHRVCPDTSRDRPLPLPPPPSPRDHD
eukprot:scaffold131_cov335-Pavlova_lutheri.AAC.27